MVVVGGGVAVAVAVAVVGVATTNDQVSRCIAGSRRVNE